MAFAGLWEFWRPNEGEELLTATIITCAANPMVAPVSVEVFARAFNSASPVFIFHSRDSGTPVKTPRKFSNFSPTCNPFAVICSARKSG